MKSIFILFLAILIVYFLVGWAVLGAGKKQAEKQRNNYAAILSE
jgi:hypothetical protein